MDVEFRFGWNGVGGVGVYLCVYIFKFVYVCVFVSLGSSYLYRGLLWLEKKRYVGWGGRGREGCI